MLLQTQGRSYIQQTIQADDGIDRHPHTGFDGFLGLELQAVVHHRPHIAQIAKKVLHGGLQQSGGVVEVGFGHRSEHGLVNAVVEGVDAAVGGFKRVEGVATRGAGATGHGQTAAYQQPREAM